ncbi:MAG: hypothetical protein JNL94_17135 [Planctomycetes bacterium]|nr:hypothetical protein [Planctomycetota bacterium]
MSARGVWIIGAGKRVVETAYPAFQRATRECSVLGVFARHARDLAIGGSTVRVEDAAQMTASRLRDVDLVYVAVGKAALPVVLGALAKFDMSRVDLLIDTPVLLPKQFRHASRFAGFRRAFVAEDCIELPWYDTIARARDAGLLGALREARFERSAYRYHAFAMVKSVFGADRIAHASRTRKGGDEIRTLDLGGGRSAVVVEPRDYSIGSFALRGDNATVTDGDASGDALRIVTSAAKDGRVDGFRIGDVATELDDDERSLLIMPRAPRVTGNMEDWKRVGFLRLLRRIHAGSGAYPIEQGLDDSFLDFRLDKFGSARAGDWHDWRSTLGRTLWSVLSRASRG